SEIAKQVEPSKILDKILKTPLTISVGEVLGTSREISQQLQEAIRAKRPNLGPSAKVDLISAAVVTTRSKRPLICLTLQCDGNLIEAIVDTGSMMNIVSRAVWKSSIPRPMD
ncbi:hypothetical protein BD309DRAFT_842927, partial [Dichomitus squalens]